MNFTFIPILIEGGKLYQHQISLQPWYIIGLYEWINLFLSLTSHVTVNEGLSQVWHAYCFISKVCTIYNITIWILREPILCGRFKIKLFGVLTASIYVVSVKDALYWNMMLLAVKDGFRGANLLILWMLARPGFTFVEKTW